MSILAVGLTVAVLAVAVFLGGGTRVGLGEDVVVQLGSLPLLVLAVHRMARSGWPSEWRFPLILVAGAVAIPLVQIVPLPPFIWERVASGRLAAGIYSAADIPLTWRPLSLSPHATLYALFSMIPAIAVFGAMATLNFRERLVVVNAALVIGIVNVLAGLIQLTQAPTPETVFATGFFANRNHYAALNYTLLPLTVSIALLYGNWLVRIVGMTFAIVAFLVGLGIAYSRAGIALGAVASAGCAILFWLSMVESPAQRWVARVALIVLVAFTAILQLGFLDLLLERGATDAERWIIAGTTLDALKGFFVMGSGLGTFVPIYQQFENPDMITGFYINHAHNDWLELALETGILGVIVLMGFVAWYAIKVFQLWCIPDPRVGRGHLLLGRAASLSVLFLLVHSVVDYPLRTTALMTMFAMCCALLLESERGGRSARSTARPPVRSDAPARQRRPRRPDMPLQSARREE